MMAIKIKIVTKFEISLLFQKNYSTKFGCEPYCCIALQPVNISSKNEK